MPVEELTYKKSGVDIEAGERFVSLISSIARSTFRPEVITDIGSFGALFKLDIKKYKEPVLVSGTDGVGTKLKIAFMMDRHDTVGIDLVAMCVNDILTSGAEPLFFLDYFATGRLSPEKAALVVKGIADGCKEAGCSLVGGETAEMPGFYADGEYDLSGFAVGVVEKDAIVNGSKISAEDAIVGIASSGLHSNGYSLVRKLLFDIEGYEIDRFIPELGCALGEELLKPTKIYVRCIFELLKDFNIKGMAHITGGGITGNLPRVFPEGLSAVIKKDSWSLPVIFELIRNIGKVSDEEMYRTFNMGIGFIIVVSAEESEKVLHRLTDLGERAFMLGFIKKGQRRISYV
ncbi:MAG TPA: phosphoribosylformylglycinamidine cyclo-ligase [Nitrospiraceae bacterium]|nr:phosphoribosylformylglycinamidine cyclo-ligase [Nitrospiraceae bacterium]